MAKKADVLVPISNESKDNIQGFEETDEYLREMWTRFEEDHAKELEYLETLRQERNFRLDEAIRGLRNDTSALDHREVKAVEIGKFKATKRWKPFYVPEIFYAICRDLECIDAAIDANVLICKWSVDYAKAKDWVKEMGVEDKFRKAEDGVEMTTAVRGPKSIPSWGGES